MKNFIEIVTEKIGEQICRVLAPDDDYDFGRLAKTMVDSNGEVFYMFKNEEQKIVLSDTQKYQAFHLFNGNLQRTQSTGGKFDPFGGIKVFQVPLTFLLFGWVAEQGNEWDVLPLFEGMYYQNNDQGKTELSAEVLFSTMDFSPASIIRKYFSVSYSNSRNINKNFLEDWPKIVHKQGEITALEIKYNVNVSTCKYCFE